MNTWWGYKHINGSYQAKRYFDDQDLKDAYSSDFVESVTGPFEAFDRNDALEIVKSRIN